MKVKSNSYRIAGIRLKTYLTKLYKHNHLLSLDPEYSDSIPQTIYINLNNMERWEKKNSFRNQDINSSAPWESKGSGGPVDLPILHRA